ncbi:unnamed protein product [Ilex paraguariensis]|uniref:Uncharacterized protein n=1 Tax=Ilex paraguariensis TaxID=185542 RepID=A0ABC8SGG0_9AQUA
MTSQRSLTRPRLKLRRGWFDVKVSTAETKLAEDKTNCRAFDKCREQGGPNPSGKVTNEHGKAMIDEEDDEAKSKLKASREEPPPLYYSHKLPSPTLQENIWGPIMTTDLRIEEVVEYDDLFSEYDGGENLEEASQRGGNREGDGQDSGPLQFLMVPLCLPFIDLIGKLNVLSTELDKAKAEDEKRMVDVMLRVYTTKTKLAEAIIDEEDDRAKSKPEGDACHKDVVEDDNLFSEYNGYDSFDQGGACLEEAGKVGGSREGDGQDGGGQNE